MLECFAVMVHMCLFIYFIFLLLFLFKGDTINVVNVKKIQEHFLELFVLPLLQKITVVLAYTHKYSIFSRIDNGLLAKVFLFLYSLFFLLFTCHLIIWYGKRIDSIVT